MSTLLESRLSPQRRAEADAADAAELAAEAAMRNLRRAQAERAVLATAAQAIDVSRRYCFDADYGVPTLHQMDQRNDAPDNSLTSLQPLGDAHVLVCYSWDSNNSLSIDGVMFGGEIVHIDNFSSFVCGQWYRAISAEERKDAEIARETAMARSAE